VAHRIHGAHAEPAQDRAAPGSQDPGRVAAVSESFYTPDPTGRCTGCKRPEDEHAPEAWTAIPRACPPADLAARRCETDEVLGHQDTVVVDVDLLGQEECDKCGSTKDCHHKTALGGTDIEPDDRADLPRAETTLEAAQARIAHLEALVVEWRAAVLSVHATERAGRRPTTTQLQRLDDAERALATSVPETADGGLS